VSTTPVIKEKILRYKLLSYFAKSLVECTLHLKIDVLLIFHVDIGRTDLSTVLLTPAKNLSAVSLLPVNSFLVLLLTPANNFRLFGYF
jgi:hypothetical protein